MPELAFFPGSVSFSRRTTSEYSTDGTDAWRCHDLCTTLLHDLQDARRVSTIRFKLFTKTALQLPSSALALFETFGNTLVWYADDETLT